MVQLSTVLSITGVTLATSLIGYVVYFDYRRRNDVDYRRQILKEKKKMDKISHAEEAKAKSKRNEELQRGIKELADEVTPSSPEEMEKYFLQHVSTGEALAAQGPDYYVASALSFYKALRMYPQPSTLLPVYKSTQPEEVFDLVIQCASSEAGTGKNLNLGGAGAAGGMGMGAGLGGAAAASAGGSGGTGGSSVGVDPNGPLLEEINQGSGNEKGENANKSSTPSSSQGSFVQVNSEPPASAPLD